MQAQRCVCVYETIHTNTGFLKLSVLPECLDMSPLPPNTCPNRTWNQVVVVVGFGRCACERALMKIPLDDCTSTAGGLCRRPGLVQDCDRIRVNVDEDAANPVPSSDREGNSTLR